MNMNYEPVSWGSVSEIVKDIVVSLLFDVLTLSILTAAATVRPLSVM